MITRYVIRPRPSGDGYLLTGPGIPYPVWYESDIRALEYALWKLGDNGGKVHILDRRGYCIITEIVAPPERTRLGFYDPPTSLSVSPPDAPAPSPPASPR